MLNDKDISDIRAHLRSIERIIDSAHPNQGKPLAKILAGGQGTGKTTAVLKALGDRAEATTNQLAELMGIPEEERGPRTRTALGEELRALGWRVVRRDGPRRERVYGKGQATPADRSRYWPAPQGLTAAEVEEAGERLRASGVLGQGTGREVHS